jgi:hypothetical protein
VTVSIPTSPAFTGTPTAPTATAGTNTTQIATTAFVTTADNLKANIASPTFTGTITSTGGIMELGAGRAVDGYAYIDLVGEPAAGTYPDYGLRLLRGNTGANTFGQLLHRGTGDFQFILQEAATLRFFTTNTERMRINADGTITFTGVPSAPTATSGTNTTQIATTAFVRTEGANLVASAPAALDTLDELAAALGDDANFATTTATAIGLKAPLASPALTGVPTAPTAAVGVGAAGNNPTQIATMASKPWNTAWGVVAFPTPQTSDIVFANTEVIANLNATFTPIANRYYKITYMEPQVQAEPGTFAVLRIKLGSTSGTQIQLSVVSNSVAGNSTLVWVGTSATLGTSSVTIVPTLQSFAAINCTVTRNAGTVAQLIVEDIGPV